MKATVLLLVIGALACKRPSAKDFVLSWPAHSHKCILNDPDEFLSSQYALHNERQQAAAAHEFLHVWFKYHKLAWGKDALKPLSATAVNGSGGVQAFLLDNLDSLFFMGTEVMFEHAVQHLVKFQPTLDFDNTESSRHRLGGLLSAYSLTQDPKLFQVLHIIASQISQVTKSLETLKLSEVVQGNFTFTEHLADPRTLFYMNPVQYSHVKATAIQEDHTTPSAWCEWASLLALENFRADYNKTEHTLAVAFLEKCKNLLFEDAEVTLSEDSLTGLPALAESLFHVYRLTEDIQYKDFAQTLLKAMKKQCRVRSGYAMLNSSGERIDEVIPQLGTILRYFYLIFELHRDFENVVFSTTGHFY